MPEISVIVPVYKTEPYLHRCIDSILAQTFANFELILVDDGSPDNCGKICDEYAQKDSRVKVIHKENGGVSSARNAGLRAAAGNWITFVDSDDYILETHLESLFHPEFDLVVTGLIQNDIDFKTSRTISLPAMSWTQNAPETISSVLEQHGRSAFSYCVSKIFSKSLIVKHNLQFAPKYSMGEDTIFSLEYLSVCRSVSFVDTCTYVYMHRSKASLSTVYDEFFFRTVLEVRAHLIEFSLRKFGTEFPVKTEHELKLMHAQAVNITANNSNLSLREKLSTFRYLFRSRYLNEAIDDLDVYFAGTSQAYRVVLKLRSPLLMLLSLTIVLKHKQQAV